MVIDVSNRVFFFFKKTLLTGKTECYIYNSMEQGLHVEDYV